MCGICGFTRPLIENNSLLDNYDEVLHTIKEMNSVIAHRGPDGEGYLFGDNIAFGHRRLSLVDLDNGAQPMSRAINSEATTHTATATSKAEDTIYVCENDDYQIIFNGEIYNYKELRTELEEKGYTFTTNSDTEVLLTSYIHWGSDCLSRLRGMFAFAVYNAFDNTLFIARDAFGIKPLYWTQTDNGVLVFASEIKSILKYPNIEKAINYSALKQYLSFQYSPLEETMFKGIYKLMPAHFMVYNLNDGKLTNERWFFPDYEIDNKISLDNMVDKIHSVIQDSVSYHKIADVEVGSFLSSGVDSNYLAGSLAKQETSIKTFTVGFDTEDGNKYNEIMYAKEAADYLGVEHYSHTITPQEFWEAFPKIQWHMDEPLADPAAAALWFVDKEASKYVKAVLSGEGADEFFGGYPIYQTNIANKKLSWIPREVLRSVSKVLNKLGIRGANYLYRVSTPVEDRFIGNANIFSVDDVKTFLNNSIIEQIDDYYGQATPQEILSGTYHVVKDLDNTTKMQYIDLNWWLVGDILLKTDKMAMAHSLESRVPFLDKEVWKIARTLPEQYKVSNETSKIALRRAAEKIMPTKHISKPKLGFPVPIRVWLKQTEYYDIIADAFHSDIAAMFFNVDKCIELLDNHFNGVEDNSRKIWVLYTFIVWYKQYFV